MSRNLTEFIVVDGEKWSPGFYRDMWWWHPKQTGRATIAVRTSGRPSQDYEEALCLMRLDNVPGSTS